MLSFLEGFSPVCGAPGNAWGAAFLLFFCQRSWRSVSAFSFRKPLSHAPVAG